MQRGVEMTDSFTEATESVVPLAEAISALREELWRACWDGQANRLKFKPAPVELTLQVAITTDRKAKGGVKWYVIEAGGELSRQAVTTQTVKLTLEPVMFDSHGQPYDEIFIEAGE
jgi:hypothetical protein